MMASDFISLSQGGHTAVPSKRGDKVSVQNTLKLERFGAKLVSGQTSSHPSYDVLDQWPSLVEELEAWEIFFCLKSMGRPKEAACRWMRSLAWCEDKGTCVNIL